MLSSWSLAKPTPPRRACHSLISFFVACEVTWVSLSVCVVASRVTLTSSCFRAASLADVADPRFDMSVGWMRVSGLSKSDVPCAFWSNTMRSGWGIQIGHCRLLGCMKEPNLGDRTTSIPMRFSCGVERSVVEKFLL